MNSRHTNDLILHVLTKIVSLFILLFSFYLFFTGHNNPGGGFIGGLMAASAILVLFLNFDRKKLREAVPFQFTNLIAIGLLVALFTGFSGMIFGFPFMTHFFEHILLPVFGEVELTTAMFFDLGVYLVVVGMAVTITLAIAEDEK